VVVSLRKTLMSDYTVVSSEGFVRLFTAVPHGGRCHSLCPSEFDRDVLSLLVLFSPFLLHSIDSLLHLFPPK